MAQCKSYPRWKQHPVPTVYKNGLTWSTQISQIWAAIGKTERSLVQIRNFSTPKFGEMRHLILKFIDPQKCALQGTFAIKNSEDPTYEQKLWVLSTLGKWSNIALEVFPKSSQLVDAANLYHLWEIETEKKLPFDLELISQVPDTLSKELTIRTCSVDYEFHKKNTQNGIVGYLYIRSKDGKELKWNQKYEIKNNVIGEDFVAVEVISKKFENLNYTCLLCLPADYTLDFGLHI